MAEKLTIGGFEVEEIKYNKKLLDTFLDISVTANRKDVNNLVHIATELSALLRVPIRHNDYSKITKEAPYIYFICNICINSQNSHTEKYLNEFNIQTTQTILDEISLINFQWGQRIKAYIFTSKNINSLRAREEGLSIKLNPQGEIYCNNIILQELNKNNLIQTNESTIALINHKRKDIHNQFAYQDLLKKLQIESNQIIQLNKIIDSRIDKTLVKKISCKISKINQVLGPIKQKTSSLLLSPRNIIEGLQSLNFDVTQHEDILDISIPLERIFDLSKDIDLIEEVGRIYGFDNFIDKIPSFKALTTETPISSVKNKIRRVLRSMGLHEVINSPFQERQGRLKYSIINPLNKEQSILRNNLIENLLNSRKYNNYQKNEIFEVFELGTVFKKSIYNKEYNERTHLCCLIGNHQFNQLTWRDQKLPLTWSQAKGQVEEFLDKMNIKVSWSIKLNKNTFIESIKGFTHPTKKLYINYKASTIGILSQLNYRTQKLLEINENIYFFEIAIKNVKQSQERTNHLKYIYKPYPNYPKITRDLSIEMSKQVLVSKLFRAIENIIKTKKDLIEDIKILNEYHDDNCENKKKICLRITYRCINRTLKNKEIALLNKIIEEQIYSSIKSKT